MEYLTIKNPDYKAVSIDWNKGLIYLHDKKRNQYQRSTELQCTEIQKHHVRALGSDYTIYGFKHMDGEIVVNWRVQSYWGTIDFKNSSEKVLNNLKQSKSIKHSVQSEIPFTYSVPV